ncbi:hypothetical protein Bca52824_019279 [Brassica carinata]|uniref:Alpha/beta hydrolase fold-3 domain-containing protein n=1 Tax=Brassica carinata TaxID=52824 RepID=A0A8X7VS64_BRACI|nr:hypothetical protein Bca52824_019279 [Brassica carinata]
MAFSLLFADDAERNIRERAGACTLRFLRSCCLLPLSSSLSCSCPPSLSSSNVVGGSVSDVRLEKRISTTREDIEWVRDLIRSNGLHMQKNELRKGSILVLEINNSQILNSKRYRFKSLSSFEWFLRIELVYKGISHYEGEEANNHTALPCPGELLVEQHHSNYGEPWAGGRDVFEFLAESSNLKPNYRVLEIGCGTLRVVYISSATSIPRTSTASKRTSFVEGFSRAWLKSKKDSTVRIFLVGDSSGGNMAHNVELKAGEAGGINVLGNAMFGGEERAESENRLDGKVLCDG